MKSQANYLIKICIVWHMSNLGNIKTEGDINQNGQKICIFAITYKIWKILNSYN